jgi:DNA-binding NtrC family response regulator
MEASAMDASSILPAQRALPGSRSDAPTLAIRQRLSSRLVGRSHAMRCLRQRIEGMASLWIPVLLRGEPGSGRSTVAELLHALGPTSAGELVRIHAASFGPEARLPGLATVHLEAVEALPRRTQAWWLERLRAPSSPGRGARFVASTERAGSMRDAAPDFDPALDAILSRFAIRVPPLRERAEDLPLLVADLGARIGGAVGRERVRFSPQAVELLAHCVWSGNVRELEDVIGRAIVFSPSAVIGRALVEDVLAERGESVGGIRADRALRERERLLAELRSSGGNVTRTAEVLGKSRPALYRLIARHGIPLSWHRRSAGRRRRVRS